MRWRLLAAALAFSACTCSKPTPSPSPTAGPSPTLPPEVLHPPTAQSCDLAQATLERLQCKRDDGSLWAKTPAGAPFGEACKAALADQRNWFPNCIQRITDCAQLDCAYHGVCCGVGGDP